MLAVSALHGSGAITTPVWLVAVGVALSVAVSRAGAALWAGRTGAGDTLFAETEILEVRESRSKPDRGTVKVHTRVLNQDGVLVAEFKRLVLVPRRQPGE